MEKSNSIFLIALVLAATLSVVNCTLSTTIVRAQIIGTGLTCSEPSPRFSRPILSGANVSVSCNGVSNTTTTDASGNFSLILNFPAPVTIWSVIRNCRVILTLPANCTVIEDRQRITTLESRVSLNFIDTSVPGRAAQFQARRFEYDD